MAGVSPAAACVSVPISAVRLGGADSWTAASEYLNDHDGGTGGGGVSVVAL